MLAEYTTFFGWSNTKLRTLGFCFSSNNHPQLSLFCCRCSVDFINLFLDLQSNAKFLESLVLFLIFRSHFSQSIRWICINLRTVNPLAYTPVHLYTTAIFRFHEVCVLVDMMFFTLAWICRFLVGFAILFVTIFTYSHLVVFARWQLLC